MFTWKPAPELQPKNPTPKASKTTPMYGLAHVTKERSITDTMGTKRPIPLKIFLIDDFEIDPLKINLSLITLEIIAQVQQLIVFEQLKYDQNLQVQLVSNFADFMDSKKIEKIVNSPLHKFQRSSCGHEDPHVIYPSSLKIVPQNTLLSKFIKLLFSKCKDQIFKVTKKSDFLNFFFNSSPDLHLTCDFYTTL
ncbi:hypothetical protein BpHYR1_015232 [Brachionus plicatilis]|uniref:Uncharacterized protein n=1 Tax=Brachionus plicatilis TaxID=10195 RepID=A0A3M7RBJ2_BRAPC|nr:hypothetical protein BpHYR1_015232 [Brachionus plicatilis]